METHHMNDKIKYLALPRVTIITSTFNCSEALAKTAASIREQSYPNIQWIIADGQSQDPTFDVIKENQDIVTDWFSEPDRGIYDAWNKASKLINGDWILFLGAGDSFHTKNSLDEFWKNVPHDFSVHSLLYGNVFITKSDGTLRYLSRKPMLNYWENGRIALPNHQGVFQARSLFNSQLPFDPTYKIAGDSKFLIWTLKTGTACHIDITLSQMQDDGVSNNIKNLQIAREEIRRICKELDLKVPLWNQFLAECQDISFQVVHLFIPNNIKRFIKQKYDSLRK